MCTDGSACSLLPRLALNTISGAWEKGLDGAAWEHDFTLIYRKVS